MENKRIELYRVKEFMGDRRINRSSRAVVDRRRGGVCKRERVQRLERPHRKTVQRQHKGNVKVTLVVHWWRKLYVKERSIEREDKEIGDV